MVKIQTQALLFKGSNLGGIRGKKTKSGGQTKNVSGSPPGQKYGMKCYDGQRVPKGTELLKQRRPETFPGWNVSLICKRYSWRIGDAT